MSLVVAALTSSCAIVLLYGYVLFPLSLLLLRSIRPRGDEPIPAGNSTQSVTATFSFINETADQVLSRVDNLLESTYLGSLEVVVVSDGAPSPVVEQIEESLTTRRHCRLLTSSFSQGKTSAQNLAVQSVETKIIVFTDANTTFEKDTISRLISALADERVGCAVGRLLYTGEGPECSYWSIEHWLKELESSFDSLVGANGAVYALRLEDYLPLPSHALSDLVEPLLIRTLHGTVTRYVPLALAHENTPTGTRSTISRKRRIFLRALSSLPLLIPALDPITHPRVAYLFVSHKLIRWLTAPLVLTVFSGLSLWKPTMALGLSMLALAVLIISRLLSVYSKPVPVLALIEHFLWTLFAQIAAWFDFLRGVDCRTWIPLANPHL